MLAHPGVSPGVKAYKASVSAVRSQHDLPEEGAMRKWLLLLASLLPLTVFADVTVYPECEYRGAGVSLAPGDYSARELKQFGIAENSISSIDVERGYAITVYEHDLWIGRNGSLRRSDPCLTNDRFDDLISSLTVRVTFDESDTPAVADAAAQSRGDAITLYAECNYRGRSASFSKGEYNLADLVEQGIDNNTISSIRVPDGFTITLYENDFLRGRAGRLTTDNECLKKDRFDDVVSSVSVRRDPSTVSTITTAPVAPASNTAVVLYGNCEYSGTAIGLKAGEYTSAQLAELGVANNTVSSIEVGEGWQIELFENDFFRGTSGTLRQNDNCLVDDRFNDQISSVIVSRNPKAPQQPITQPVAVTVFAYCNYKGGSAKLTSGHYDQKALAKLGVGDNVVSSLKVAEGYSVTLYDDPAFGGRGRKLSANDDCLDDEGLNDLVSSLVIEPLAAGSAGSLTELPPPKQVNPLDYSAVDEALSCVGQYVERDICDSQRWRDMTTRCQLGDVELMTDGYLRGHVEAGNCKTKYWSELSRRVANPRLR
jgi:hypothetical protein